MGLEHTNTAPESLNRQPKSADRKEHTPSPVKEGHQRVINTSSEELDRLRREQSEKALEEPSASKMENKIDRVVDAVEKHSKKLQPIIEKVFALHERVSEAMQSILTPYIPQMQKMGMEIPAWLIAGVPGLAVLHNVLQKSGRVLIPQKEKDGAGMRKLMKEHKKLERGMKAKGKAYAFEEFLDEIVTDVPGSSEEIRIDDISRHSEVFAQNKAAEIAKMTASDEKKKSKEDVKKKDEKEDDKDSDEKTS